MSSSKIILVIGATGNQGGAVVRSMVKHRTDFKLRALTRNPTGSSAQKLIDQGVDEVVQGDIDDEASLRKAMQDAYGVYAVTPYGARNKDAAEREERQGKLIAQIAAEASVKHFVFSSVGNSVNAPEVAQFNSKWHIEQYIHELGRSKGLPYTILRPNTFMDMLWPAKDAGRYLSAMRAHMDSKRKVYFISLDDIGHFARLTFEKPDEYIGKTVTLAGDELSREDICAIYKRVTGSEPSTMWLPCLAFKLFMNEIHIMFNWFNRVGYGSIDIAQLRQAHPKLQSFETFLRAQIQSKQ